MRISTHTLYTKLTKMLMFGRRKQQTAIQAGWCLGVLEARDQVRNHLMADKEILESMSIDALHNRYMFVEKQAADIRKEINKRAKSV